MERPYTAGQETKKRQKTYPVYVTYGGHFTPVDNSRNLISNFHYENIQVS